MKKLFFIFIGFMFAVQTAFASPGGDKMNFETLNKTDTQILFQNNVTSRQKIIVLDVNQMNELKAKGWWHRIRRGIRHTYHRTTHYRLNSRCFRNWFSGRNHRRCHLIIKK